MSESGSQKKGSSSSDDSNKSEDQRQTDDTHHEGQRDEEAIPTSVRGAPAHLREEIVRGQNARVRYHEKHSISVVANKCRQSARRSRERRKQEIADLFAKYNSFLKEIDQLENRVAALESILRAADIEVPNDFGRAIIESITTARAAVEGTLELGEDEPDNDQLFREMLNNLETDKSNRSDGAGPSNQ